MSTITASQVNELRQQTGAGMMECKKALTETNGDFEAAIDLLRKKGQKVSALRAGKEAPEGAVVAKTTADGKNGVIIKLSSETDFVAKNEAFQAFANSIAEIALANLPADLAALEALPMEGSTVGDKVVEMVGKINENIRLTSYEKLQGASIVAYNHAGNKIGVLVQLNQPATDAINAIGKDVAMQVAAMNPVAVDKTKVDASLIEREIAIGKEQALAEGKPEAMIEKIAYGKLERFYKDNTLISQQFVKDTSINVEQALKQVDKGLEAVDFKRVALG